MSGFTGIVIFTETLETTLASFSYPENLKGFFFKKETINRKNFTIANYSNNKFNRDSTLKSFNNPVYGLNGIQLKNADNTLADLKSTEDFTNFVKHSRGSFSAFYLDPEQSSVILAADQTSSRPIFYYHNQSFAAFSGSIFLLLDILRHFHVHTHLEQDAAYMMLSLGYMLEDFTLVSEIKKAKAGTLVTLNALGRDEKTYHQYFRNIQFETISNDLLHGLDQLFRKSLELEYQKDREYGFKHIATLSGGLDSRLNVMLAYEYGFSDITALTFSEGFKSDELTARKITHDLELKHLLLILNGGFQLYDPETPLYLNNCSVYYFGAAQVLAAVTRINFNSYGLLHNGVLAESSKGGYLSGPEHTKPQLNKRYAISDRLFNRFDEVTLQTIFDKYPNEEMFVTYNRGFNAIHNGSWMTLPFTDSVNTYMDVDFADLAYSIHPKLRLEGRLTVDWIETHHPQLSKYPWKYGITPTYNQNKIFSAKVKNKLKRKLFRKQDDPVPFSDWYKNNKSLREFLHEQYRRSPGLPLLNNELKINVKLLFDNGTVEEKFLCVSLLKSVEMLFCV